MTQLAASQSTVGEAFRPSSYTTTTDEAQLPVRKPNRLPLDEYRGAKAYRLTLATAGRSVEFGEPKLVEHCLNELRRTASLTNFEVLAYCFTPDHLHLLVAGVNPSADVVGFIKRFKQSMGLWFKNEYQGGLEASPTGLWQRSYHDHILRSDESLQRAAEYVILNPVQAGLVKEPEDYPYSGSFVWPQLISSE